MYKRILDLQGDVKRKSVFLLGPRQTGKTSLLKQSFPKAKTYNLLQSDVFAKLVNRPQLIREEAKRGELILIDEIQKYPGLLDEVQYLVDEYKCRFVLTGSSARKLKRGAANLLGGRAKMSHLFPLVSAEIPNFDLMKSLNIGTLPSVYDSTNPGSDLQDYIGTYLQEEIQAEGIVRKIENFSRFLQTASLVNGELLNFENVASDAQVPPRTIREYFHILEDTLIGTLLPPFLATKKRKPISTAKFYFFDVGVANILAGRESIKPKTELFGKVLEHFIFCEIKAFLSYSGDRREFAFWRSKSDFEVDFLIGSTTAIEVKGTELVTERHLRGLVALSEDLKLKNKIVVSLDSRPRKISDVHILPVKDFLHRLWDGAF